MHLVEPPYDVVANLPYHITSPILHALLGRPPRPERLVLMVQREVAERIAAPPGQDELPVGLRAVPRLGPDRLRRAADRLRAGAGGRVGGDRGRAVRRRRPPGARGRRRAVATRPGRVPRAAQDDPQRPGPPAAGRCRAASPRPSPRRRSTRIGGPRRSRSASGWPCTRRSVRSGAIVVGVQRERAALVSGQAADPTRRLTPVVRLAPAKLNLTLAVVGRRPDGYHVLHSVFVPLGLADRLSLSPAGADRDSLHVTGFDGRTARGQPGAPRDRRDAGRRRWRVARRARSRSGPGRSAREADPGRRRAGRRVVGRRGDARRRARGVGSGAGSRDPARDRGRASARTSRSSWPAAPPWSRGAASRSRRSTASTAAPGCCS